MVKKILFISLFLCMFLMSGCKTDIVEDGCIEVLDTNTIEGIMNVDFSYQFYSPGQQLSYNHLWDGYDTINKFGPNVSEKDRLYTYLTEYKESENDFYLVYLKQDRINSYQSWLQQYEEANAVDDYNYHFSTYDNQNIIDGKYLYCFQRLNGVIDSNVKIYKTEDINNIKLNKDEYQLIFCAKRKQAIIKENLSSSKVLNKEIDLYSRYELIFEDTETAPTYYEFEGWEQHNQNLVKEMFDYVGEMLEPFPSTYESLTYSSFPYLGLGNFWCLNVRVNVVVEEGKKYLLLPRYKNDNNELIDLLSDETDFFLQEDVFRGYKSDFLEAFVKEINTNNSSTVMALYDYEAVISIMRKD